MIHPKKKKIKRLRRYIRASRFLFSQHMSFWIVLGGAVLILLGIGVFLWKETLFSFGNTIKTEKVGQLGDFIGGIVGSIWALAGVILFYVALTLQRKEFQLQRQELRETRGVFEQQAKLLQSQQKEHTFFNLLNNHNSFAHNFTKRDRTNGGNISGFVVINQNWEEIRSSMEHYSLTTSQKKITPTLAKYYLPHKNLKEDKVLNSIYTYLTHVISFIINQLENDQFYHVTFYNNITNEEKLILGSFIAYEVGYSYDAIDFEKIPFNYAEEYKKQKYYVAYKDMPPFFNCEIINSSEPLPINMGKDSMPRIRLLYSLGTTIESITLSYDYVYEDSIEIRLEEFVEVQTDNDLIIEFSPYDFINEAWYNKDLDEIIKNDLKSIIDDFNFGRKILITSSIRYNNNEFIAVSDVYYQPHIGQEQGDDNYYFGIKMG